ncbi:hypothetical protein [Desulfovibrio inopinatus]|uniref:hypothetical protein n=1 Tax=Desulfovibrio inopinatus TaxID=102109 RepID=UPI0004154082|nr:hypothetical protein [Desulfovibrio inopinatus]
MKKTIACATLCAMIGIMSLPLESIAAKSFNMNDIPQIATSNTGQLPLLLAHGGFGNGSGGGGYGPGDGTGTGDGPHDGTGNGPGDCTTS